MAKKLVKTEVTKWKSPKRKSILYVGLFLIVFFAAWFLFGSVQDIMSGEMTLVDWMNLGGGAALWSWIVLSFLEWAEVGGYKWMRVCENSKWVAFSLGILLLSFAFFAGDQLS